MFFTARSCTGVVRYGETEYAGSGMMVECHPRGSWGVVI
jgi:hypothetical protein